MAFDVTGVEIGIAGMIDQLRAASPQRSVHVPVLVEGEEI